MSKKFKDLKLEKEIQQALSALEYKEMTKVQERAIPIALEGRDIVVKSQTGSGKTLAFTIPICNEIKWDERRPQALIISPTRELAMQISDDMASIGRLKRLKLVELYGKSPYYKQKNLLSQRTHIVVGTPGRIIDHIGKGSLDLSQIRYLVIDEADEMLNMGFIDQLEKIISSIKTNKTSMLFSATMPENIEKLYKKYLDKPAYIEIESENLVVDRVEQKAYIYNGDEKLDLLRDILIVENPDRAIIFSNTRDGVDRIYEYLERGKNNFAKIHGAMDQRDRTKVMDDFKSGYFRYLIATDLASRGIDVDNISHVINFDIPFEVESYVHRMGRTARIGKTGFTISILNDYEKKYLDNIEKSLSIKIPFYDRPNKFEIEKNKDDFYKKLSEKPEKSQDRSVSLNKSILKLHINAGKKSKIRAGDIVGSICSIDHIEASDIGIITIIDGASFVEILNDKGMKVLEELRKIPIKARVRKVNIARK